MGAQSQGVSSVLVSTLMQREALNERILSNFMQVSRRVSWRVLLLLLCAGREQGCLV